MLEEAAFAVRDGCWTVWAYGDKVSEASVASGRPWRWPGDRNKMSDFRGVGSRREVTRNHPWVCSELLSRRWREVGVDTAEGGGRRKWRNLSETGHPQSRKLELVSEPV